MNETEPGLFEDHDAGPEESEEIINNEENQEAAKLIRESTYGAAIGEL